MKTEDDRFATTTAFALVAAIAVGSLLPVGMMYGIPWLRRRAQQRRLTRGTTIIGGTLDHFFAAGRYE